jgi:hypothetical protein
MTSRLAVTFPELNSLSDLSGLQPPGCTPLLCVIQFIRPAYAHRLEASQRVGGGPRTLMTTPHPARV